MLRERLQTAIPLIGLLALALFLPGAAGRLLFTVFALLMLGGAVREGFQLADGGGRAAFQGLTTVYGLALVANAMLWQDLAYLESMLLFDDLITLCFILAAFALAFRTRPTAEGLRSILASLALGLYLCWTLSFVPKTYTAFLEGPRLLFAMIIVCKMADVGGYFIGSLTARLPGGNHKICPRISPGKSWEGLLGGIAFSTGTIAVLHRLRYAHEAFSPASVWILGVAMPVVGLLGDLAESVVKRAAGAKDSGHVPGLGGVLDMLDSLIPCAPFFFFYLLFTLRYATPLG